jgi:nitrogen fixation protein FixH
MNPLLSLPVAPGSHTEPSGRSPWPYALIAAFALFISGVVSFIVFAVRQPTDLVRPDYYAQEIKYQEQIDRVKRTALAAEGIRLELAPGGRELRLSLPAGHTAAFTAGTLSLYRPSDARQDRNFALQPLADGSQAVVLTGLEPGLWRARMQWTSGGVEYFHEQSVQLSAVR